MLEHALTALLYDVTSFLRKDATFFTKSLEERKELLVKASLPSQVKTYLTNAEEKAFLKDIQSLVEFIKEPNHSLDNELMLAIAAFFSEEFGSWLDLEKDKFSFENTFSQELCKLRDISTTQEISQELHLFLAKIAKTPYVVIQSAVPLSGEDKASMRKELLRSYPRSFPLFSINKDLLGGMRVFVDGKTIEYSWKSHIHTLFSSLYSVVT